jgi:hypothetical protein
MRPYMKVYSIVECTVQYSQYYFQSNYTPSSGLTPFPNIAYHPKRLPTSMSFDTNRCLQYSRHTRSGVTRTHLHDAVMLGDHDAGGLNGMVDEVQTSRHRDLSITDSDRAIPDRLDHPDPISTCHAN